jgi:hypothetical protein
VPPPKFLAAFARKDNLVYMFGGLYHRQAGDVFSTPCTFSYDLAADRWTYHHAVPPPYQETGLWGASAFYDVVADAFYIMWGLQGWPFAGLEEFLLGGLADWDPSEWDWNRNVYVYRPGGPGAQAGGQPGAGGAAGKAGATRPGGSASEGEAR